MTEYRVQSILIDSTGKDEVETIVDSFRTTDYEKTLDMVMCKHKLNSHYLYVVMEIDTQKIIYKSKDNKYLM